MKIRVPITSPFRAPPGPATASALGPIYGILRSHDVAWEDGTPVDPSELSLSHVLYVAKRYGLGTLNPDGMPRADMIPLLSPKEPVMPSKTKTPSKPSKPSKPSSKPVASRALRARGGIQRATGGTGKGRPALSESGSIQMSPIRVPPELYQRVVNAALASGLSVSAWVRSLMERAS